MPDHDALLRTACLQWGYVTSHQAAAHGFSRQLCNHYCRKGSWLHVARTVYRILAVPEHPDEDLALVHLLARDRRGRPAGVLSHDTALYLHGMLDRRPSKPHLSLDAASRLLEPERAVVFHRRVDVPWRVDGYPARPAWLPAAPDPGAEPPADGRTRWTDPWRAVAAASGPALQRRHPPLPAEDIEERSGFRVTTPLRSILDVQAWRRHSDLSDVVARGLQLELFDVEECIEGLEGLLRFPGQRGLWELLRAVEARAGRAQRDLRVVRLRVASLQQANERRIGAPLDAFEPGEDATDVLDGEREGGT